MHVSSVIVPWFSRKEWLEVYRGAYGDDVNAWKAARDTMLVWQARVHKLPIGVDLTLPLLQAKIVDADPLVDSDVKFIMQGTAIQRFVSNVTKLPQTKYYHAQTLHKLAASIGLPGHLVDLRNEIIHGDSGWFGGCTVSEALETCYHWVKHYYWYNEQHQMKIRKWNSSLEYDKRWKKCTSLLTSYAATEVATDELSYSKICLRIVDIFAAFFPTNPKENVEAVVMHILMTVAASQISSKNNRKSGKKTSCGCLFRPRILEIVSAVLNSILLHEGVAELLVESLITKGQGSEKLAVEWIYVLIASLIELPGKKHERGRCKVHLLDIQSDIVVNWKSVVSNLLNVEEKWGSNLAIRLMKATRTEYSKSQIKQIDDLLKILKSRPNKKNPTDTKKISNGITDNDLYNVDSILEEALKHGSQTQQLTKKFKETLLSSSSSADVLTPLGVLPHQIDNKQLYKELLLHYPEDRSREPPLKRKKT